MVSVGYFLACETWGPHDLVRQARWAEEAGFERLWISDHFHPWTDAQGNSPFVWGVIGALSQVTRLPITTAVTCPTVRVHPAVVAQAAATAAVQCEGRFVLGVGSGEYLNEHVLGDHWPPADVRLAMLEEAVELIRALHRGDRVTYRGEYYEVENARIYTLPEEPVPIYVSGFGPKSAQLAGRIGDGYICTKPDRDLVRRFRECGGEGLPAQAGFKVCWAPTEEQAVATVRRLWPTEALPGELSQVLPEPRHFEQASQLVTDDALRQAVPCGPDLERQLAQVRAFAEAGFDEVYVQQVGPDQERFFELWRDEVLPRVRESAVAAR
ncbi:F420-dependent oxidoreductase, G6PDH family [Streptoalloteichus tenebrarius]|uniref:F420-dependent oxidoreductase, G6PDH family n=1 Tax=Streptoalloteichus tenebrarius (strain ATCC 17920 / DSM 40477 / JCM 4838 / CBS 697.72 / NBRC 16177 / NCIMB 11028 / NRRL B-12390 / A12253. 1 / ISP 5477) TaxID=1933 RepID=A0ABT1HQC1_STRSD|nr:TIGR03557 family F420-dependent LLM class oxidoreductase [Streptoalloteichus tenebrarius]MCP2257708.1 F420-dependent oxidoreductase, G6PDH family [Streptoalloteichus tenebrarius]BFE99938.1 LLM class F420-dependent oxidoreductase [Streptoalloteichus tenebrarius]